MISGRIRTFEKDMAAPLADYLVTQSGEHLEKVFSFHNWKPGQED